MSKKRWFVITLGTVAIASFAAAKISKRKAERTTYKSEAMEPIDSRSIGIFEKHIKRIIDVACAVGAITVFCPLYIGVGLLVKIKLGSPVLFTQERPGMVDESGNETIFKMYKFRTMTDARDENGELLPDDVRLTKFGAWLRKTSLDELPEAFNILNGTMSVIGPRPQLVRDMVFMSKKQRERHSSKPGLSGLAQVNGRNAITWEEKINWDLKYIEKVSFMEDVKIVLDTIKKAFIRQEGITQEEMSTAEDFGDYLLRTEKISSEEYSAKQAKATRIMKKTSTTKSAVLENYDFSVSMCVYQGDEPDSFDAALKSVVEQSLQPNEIVLTVDGPIPNDIRYVIEKYKTRLKETSIDFNVIYLEQNVGHGEARRVCFEHCTYDLIALMDADDLSVPMRFENQIAFLKNNPDVSVIGGNISEFIGDVDCCVGRRVVPKNDSDIKRFMKKRCPMNQVTVMFKKEDVASVGGYIDWYCEEDYYLWVRLALAGFKFGNIQDDLVYVRVGKEMYSRRGGVKYFASETKLQKYMYDNDMISTARYLINVGERLVLQVLMPNNSRGFIFQKLARVS